VTVAQEDLTQARQNHSQLMAMQHNAADLPAVEASADAVRTAEASVHTAQRDVERARITTELQV